MSELPFAAPHVLTSTPGRQLAEGNTPPPLCAAKNKKAPKHDLLQDHGQRPQRWWATTDVRNPAELVQGRMRPGFSCSPGGAAGGGWGIAGLVGSASLSFPEEETEVRRGEASGL